MISNEEIAQSVGSDIVSMMHSIVTMDIPVEFMVDNVSIEFDLGSKCGEISGMWKITIKKVR